MHATTASLTPVFRLEKTALTRIRRKYPAFGKRFTLGGNEVSVLGSIGVSNDLQTMDNASIRTLEATGTLNEFNYDSYSNELKLAALGNLWLQFPHFRSHRIYLLLRPQCHRHLYEARR